MKKILATIVLVIMLVASMFTVVACKGGDTDYSIEIVKFGAFSALNSASKGFQDRINEWAAEEGIKVTFNEKDTNAQTSNVGPAVDAAIANGPNLIYAIATPCAVQCAGATSDIPVIYTAVTDPEDAGLKGIANVYGTSDMNPVEKQIELIKELIPDAAKVGFLYSSNETNSQVQVAMAKTACTKFGLTFPENDFTISSTADIQAVMELVAASDIDALYIPTDNVIADNMAVVASANSANIPLIVGEEGMASNGGWATLSIDYEKLGRQSAEIAIKVLKGEAVTDAERHQMYTGALNFVVSDEAKTALGLTDEKIAQIKTKFGA